MDINEIQKILPHRYPFLLIDKIIEFEPDISAHAIKCVTINEPFFKGHFPGRPLMPGVLVIEAIVENIFIADNDSELSNPTERTLEAAARSQNIVKIQKFYGISPSSYPINIHSIVKTVNFSVGVDGYSFYQFGASCRLTIK